MNDLVIVSGAQPPDSLLPTPVPANETAARPPGIARCGLLARIAAAAQAALMVWGGISLAGVALAAVVYGQGDYGSPVGSADGISRPLQVAAAPPAVKKVNAAPNPVESAPASQPPMESAAMLRPGEGGASPTPVETTGITPEPASGGAESPDPTTVIAASDAAAVLRVLEDSAASEPGASVSPTPSADDPPSAVEPPIVDARLPRPRPDEPLVTGSIEPPHSASPPRPARRHGYWPRFAYRYRMAPL